MGIFNQFPYSNFHDMNMDEIIKICRELQDAWTATSAEWANYKDFIDNYFENLDVSEEVLAALRIFASDGTLNRIMDPVIAETTADWLLNHISATSGETVIDTSLSVEGAAADAKTTGLFAKYGLNYGGVTSFSQILTQGLYIYNKNTFTDELPDTFSQYGYILCLFNSSTADEKFFIIFDENLNAVIKYNNKSESITYAKKYKGVLSDFADAQDGIYAVSPSTLNVPSMNGAYGWIEVTIYDNGYKTATLYRDSGSVVTYAYNTWYNIFHNNTWYLIGDSLTEINSTASRNWTKLFESEGANIVNLGVGGTGFAKTENRYINRIDQLPAGYCNIGVSASFNDMSAGVEIGEPTDTGTTSVCGYINDFFDALMAHNPSATIICYAMPPWDVYHYGVSRSDRYINNLEIICKTRGIAFDRSLYDQSDMRPWVQQYRNTFYTDGSHPNNYGHIKIWNHLQDFFSKNSNEMLRR